MIIIVAGEGGHLTQAKRLLMSLELDEDVLHITDNCHAVLNNVTDSVIIEPLRGKYGVNVLSSFTSIFSNFITIYSVFKKNLVSRVVSTGPGISISVAIIAKLFKTEVIHIETWSRFKSKSITGRVMYFLADIFIVQHKSLIALYPKAKYGGLL